MLASLLKQISLDTNQYAVITSDNHAIGFYRTPGNTFVLYNPLTMERPKTWHSLLEVAEAIIAIFGAINRKRKKGNQFKLKIDTFTFGVGEKELAASIKWYQENHLFE